MYTGSIYSGLQNFTSDDINYSSPLSAADFATAMTKYDIRKHPAQPVHAGDVDDKLHQLCPQLHMTQHHVLMLTMACGMHHLCRSQRT